MFPLLGILVAFVLGLAYPGVRPRPVPPDLLGSAAVLLVYAATARALVSGAVARIVKAGEDATPEPLLKATATTRLLSLLAYAALVYAFDWPRTVELLGIEGWILLPHLVVLGPFFLFLAIQIGTAWRGEAALGLHEFRRGAYFAFQLRQYLLPTIPLFAFLLLGDLFEFASARGVEWVARLRILYLSYPFLQWLTLAGLLLALYCVIPFLMRLFWRATPMPAGPLRDRLEEFSRREGFRAREILVWPTGGNVVNAAVIGIAGPVRYVLLTDGLIETLREDEVEAVFAHEVGHAKHNHMLFFFLYTIAFTLLMFLARDLLEGAVRVLPQDPGLVSLLFILGFFLVWFGILFGFVSRRFEQQADVYGALSTGRVHPEEGESGDPSRHPFVRALEGLARQMGDIREARPWRHFPLAQRIGFLKEFLASETIRRRYRRRMTGLLVLFFGLLLALATAAATTIPEQLRMGKVRSLGLRARWLAEQDRNEEAGRAELQAELLARELGVELPERRAAEGVRAWTMRALDLSREERLVPQQRAALLLQVAEGYRRLGWSSAARAAATDAIRLSDGHPVTLYLLGLILSEQGRTGGARLAFEDALAKVPEDTPFAATVREELERLEGPR